VRHSLRSPENPTQAKVSRRLDLNNPVFARRDSRMRWRALGFGELVHAPSTFGSSARGETGAVAGEVQLCLLPLRTDGRRPSEPHPLRPERCKTIPGRMLCLPKPTQLTIAAPSHRLGGDQGAQSCANHNISPPLWACTCRSGRDRHLAWREPRPRRSPVMNLREPFTLVAG